MKRINASLGTTRGKSHGPENGAINSLRKGVDLDLCRIFLFEDLVKIDKRVSCLLSSLVRRKSEFLGHIESDVFGQPRRKWYRRRDDGGWILGRDLFDIHSALVRRNKHDP